MKDVIFVTGSSRGLGLEIARDLALNNFSILLSGRDYDALQKGLSSLNRDLEHYAFEYDLVQSDSVQRLQEFLHQNQLNIVGVVHNLGGKVENDIQPLLPVTLQKSLRLNLEVGVEINNFLIPQMIKCGFGKIIHIGSSAGYNGNAAPAYAISKGALNTYIKNSARYYAKDGITICAVLPGILDHEGSEWDKKSKNEPEKYNQRKAQMPLGRFSKPDEIAPFITSIFKIDSIQITGSIISLEGGV